MVNDFAQHIRALIRYSFATATVFTTDLKVPQSSKHYRARGKLAIVVWEHILDQ